MSLTRGNDFANIRSDYYCTFFTGKARCYANFFTGVEVRNAYFLVDLNSHSLET